MAKCKTDGCSKTVRGVQNLCIGCEVNELRAALGLRPIATADHFDDRIPAEATKSGDTRAYSIAPRPRGEQVASY